MENKKLAVFCGANVGNNPRYKEAAIELAAAMVANKVDLVFGGGKVGIMGVMADEIMRQGGKAFGVIPEKLMAMEVGHEGITELKIVKTMHERKALMAEMSDAFVALPGGIGTLEEIIEVFTWHQIGYHKKTCALLNTDNYYDSLIQFINDMVDQGFLSANQKDQLLVTSSVNELIHDIF